MTPKGQAMNPPQSHSTTSPKDIPPSEKRQHERTPSQKGTKIFQQTLEDMEHLSRLWPRIFILDMAKARHVFPLAIGIHKDIYPTWKAKGINGVRLKRALKWYCNRLAYQAALANGRPRINLTGRIVASVDEDHQRLAREKVSEILQKKSCKRKPQKAKHRRPESAKIRTKPTKSSKVRVPPRALSEHSSEPAKPRFRRTLTLSKTA